MKRTVERGFTLVEIMIVVAIIALLAAIAIPNVLRGRTTANESAAIGNIRALVSSLEMFRSVNQVYPAAGGWMRMYDATASVCTAGTNPDPDFGPPSFCLALTGASTDVVQGFTYTYTGGTAPAGTYDLLATPRAVGTDGTRAFYANQTGLIRHCSDALTAMTVANLAGENTIDAQPNSCNNALGS